MLRPRTKLVAGFTAGVAEVLVGYPFDMVKTQLQAETLAAGRTGFEGPWDCAWATYKRDGLLGFYRGVAAPMLQEAIGVAILFSARDWLRVHLGADIAHPAAFVLGCCLVGLAEALVYCPLDHLKARLQVRGSSGELGPSPSCSSPWNTAAPSPSCSQSLAAHRSRDSAAALPPATLHVDSGAPGPGASPGGCADATAELAVTSHAWCPSPIPSLRSPRPAIRGPAASQPPSPVQRRHGGGAASGVSCGGSLKGRRSEGELAAFLKCAKAVVRMRGFCGLYLGFCLEAIKEMLGNIALFGTYDVVVAGLAYCQAQWELHGGLVQCSVVPSCFAVVAAGSLAGVAYYTIGYPFDTVKSRLQTDSLRNPRYKGWLHCLQTALAEDSPASIFRGVSLCLARAVPGCAVQFLVYETVVRALGGIHVVDTQSTVRGNSLNSQVDFISR